MSAFAIAFVLSVLLNMSSPITEQCLWLATAAGIADGLMSPMVISNFSSSAFPKR